MNKLFSDRKLTHSLSGEFLEYGCNAETEKQKEAVCQDLSKRVEDSYEVVSDVTTDGFAFNIICILTRTANREAVLRGLQEMEHQIHQEYGDGF